MAASPCLHCHGTVFELETTDVQNATFQYAIVRCAGCGAPIGVVEDENIAGLLHDQEMSIAELGDQISNIDKTIETVSKNIETLLRRVPRQ